MRLPRLLLSFIALLPLTAVAQQPVRAVPQLDISRYAGQWHEIAHLPVSFQKNAAATSPPATPCVTMAWSACATAAASPMAA